VTPQLHLAACWLENANTNAGAVMSRHGHLLQLLLSWAILVAESAGPHDALAQTTITGAEDDVMVEAHDSSVQEVLAALGAKFGLRYRNITALDRRIDGTYGGSLHRVVTRLLDGSSYVMSTGGGHIEVILVSAAKRNEMHAQPSTAVFAPTRRRSD
jgi:hypothetical protein